MTQPQSSILHINRKTFCNAFPNHFVSLLHQLTQNEL
nr:MAG TPA: Soluble guanylyl cyclase alpha-1 subunit oxide, cyclase, H-NOX, SIGNALING [Caudoviricetes sp.]